MSFITPERRMLQSGSQDTETIAHCLLKSTSDYWGPITLLQWVRGGFKSYTQKKVHPDIAHCPSARPLISYFFLKGRGRGRGNSVNLIPEVCKGRRQDSFLVTGNISYNTKSKLLSIFNTFSSNTTLGFVSPSCHHLNSSTEVFGVFATLSPNSPVHQTK